MYCLNPALQNDNVKRETLGLLRIEPDTEPILEKSEILRPDGTSCKIKAWDPYDYNTKLQKEPDIELTLTEFADPSGVLTYFLLTNPVSDKVVDDELLVKP